MQAREREIDQIELAPVVRRSDNAICRINLDPVAMRPYVFLSLICWMAIYPLEGFIRPLYS